MLVKKHSAPALCCTHISSWENDTMTRDTRNTGSGVRYDFYTEELRKAEKPYTICAAFAISIGKCKEYTKAEKGRALETLTMAWMDLFGTN